MAFDEFAAWCAYLNHAEFHREDAELQSKHDAMMNAALAASRG